MVLACSLATASVPSHLQDFCVAINDFKFKTCGVRRHNIPKSTANPVGSIVTTVNVEQILGLNTTRHILCIDYAANGGQTHLTLSLVPQNPSSLGGHSLCWLCDIKPA
ncbi:hypothetical protein CUMW_231580 [Citrus unshiu]|uniref:Uncharacterized protein n=1 Tax=Citrus unshiu TaxID=55188 RepID=A0A2H5QHS4_CITUN|nr:hypothetical protein CUMW_231580 [Citrus unshiu]